MKRSCLNIFIFGCILFCLTACQRGNHYPMELRQADSVANTDPDGALLLLNTIADAMETASEPTRMYYKLTCIKSADKAYVTHTSDSLILSLVHYYEHRGDKALLGEAYYYAGRVYRDLKDAPRALSYFQKSRQATEDESNPALYAQMGEIFFEQSFFPEALQMYQEAHRLDSLANDTLGRILDLRDIAFTHRVQHMQDSALIYLKQAEHLALLYDDPEIMSLITAQLAGLYHRMGQQQEALHYIERALPNAGEADKYSIYDTYANILLSEGNLEEAEVYYTEMTQADNVQIQLDAYGGLAQIASMERYAEDYQKYFNLYRLYSDSLRRVTATESISRMNALYNYQIHEQENNTLRLQNQQKQMLLIAIVGVSLLLIVTLAAYYQYRRLQMKHRLEHVQQLLKEHLEKESRQEQLKQMERAINESEVKKRLEVYIAEEKPIKDEDIADIESLLNEVHPSFIPLLHQFGDMNPLEFQVSLLLKLGLSPMHIAALVLRDKSTISAIRRRLYKKTTGQNGSPSDWDSIIQSL